MSHGSLPCAEVLSERDLRGASVRMVEYQWSDDDSVFRDSLDNIHFRIAPYRMRLNGRIDGGPEVSLGQVTMMPAGSELKFSTPHRQDSARVISCSLTEGWLEQLAGARASFMTNDPSRIPATASANSLSAFQRMAVELTAPGFASDAYLDGALQMAVIELMREIHGTDWASPSGRLSRRQLARVVAMIRQSEDSSPKASELAAEIGLSVSHFRCLFKASTGQTVHDYVMQDRVERAKALLIDGTLSLKTIAYRLGFSCPSAFSIAFRRAMGCSPSEFRRVRLL